MEQNIYDGALQKPVDSGFSVVSTTSDVIRCVDLNGKIAIVIGGDGGLTIIFQMFCKASGTSI